MICIVTVPIDPDGSRKRSVILIIVLLPVVALVLTNVLISPPLYDCGNTLVYSEVTYGEHRLNENITCGDFTFADFATLILFECRSDRAYYVFTGFNDCMVMDLIGVINNTDSYCIYIQAINGDYVTFQWKASDEFMYEIGVVNFVER